MTQAVTVVTGASRGIGAAILRRLAADGHAVVGTWHSARAEADALAAAHDGVRFERLDCADPGSVAAFLEALGETPVAALVNNAGTIGTESLARPDWDLWRRSFAVHCDAALALVAGLDGRFAPGAAIVNVASTDADLGGYDTFSYSASMAALVSLTRSMAVNLGHRGIRANAVAPGWIDTEMGTRHPEAAVGHTPLGRLGTPEDVAGAVAFLLGPDAAYVTGHTLVVDGGYYLVDPVMKLEAEDGGWPDGAA